MTEPDKRNPPNPKNDLSLLLFILAKTFIINTIANIHSDSHSIIKESKEFKKLITILKEGESTSALKLLYFRKVNFNKSDKKFLKTLNFKNKDFVRNLAIDSDTIEEKIVKIVKEYNTNRILMQLTDANRRIPYLIDLINNENIRSDVDYQCNKTKQQNSEDYDPLELLKESIEKYAVQEGNVEHEHIKKCLVESLERLESKPNLQTIADAFEFMKCQLNITKKEHTDKLTVPDDFSKFFLILQDKLYNIKRYDSIFWEVINETFIGYLVENNTCNTCEDSIVYFLVHFEYLITIVFTIDCHVNKNSTIYDEKRLDVIIQLLTTIKYKNYGIFDSAQIQNEYKKIINDIYADADAQIETSTPQELKKQILEQRFEKQSSNWHYLILPAENLKIHLQKLHELKKKLKSNLNPIYEQIGLLIYNTDLMSRNRINNIDINNDIHAFKKCIEELKIKLDLFSKSNPTYQIIKDKQMLDINKLYNKLKDIYENIQKNVDDVLRVNSTLNQQKRDDEMEALFCRAAGIPVTMIHHPDEIPFAVVNPGVCNKPDKPDKPDNEKEKEKEKNSDNKKPSTNLPSSTNWANNYKMQQPKGSTNKSSNNVDGSVDDPVDDLFGELFDAIAALKEMYKNLISTKQQYVDIQKELNLNYSKPFGELLREPKLNLEKCGQFENSAMQSKANIASLENNFKCFVAIYKIPELPEKMQKNIHKIVASMYRYSEKSSNTLTTYNLIILHMSLLLDKIDEIYNNVNMFCSHEKHLDESYKLFESDKQHIVNIKKQYKEKKAKSMHTIIQEQEQQTKSKQTYKLKPKTSY
jgi:hypothetical protein